MKIINTIKNHIMKVAMRKNKELPFVHMNERDVVLEDLKRLQNYKQSLIEEGADPTDLQVIEDELKRFLSK